MFTGIIEAVGILQQIRQEGSNFIFTIESPFTSALKVDQSVSHNGACLTVTAIHDDTYEVIAVEETLQKTNLGSLQIGHSINLERSMQMNGRIDGHIVQGHVDRVGICQEREDRDGSWIFTFSYDASTQDITVEKGSICVNGVSLTVVNSQTDRFSVAIIPYTYEHTNFKDVKVNDPVNLEFDILGKYVQKYLSMLPRPS